MGDITLIAVLGIIWFFIFIFFRHLRKEMIFTSLFPSLLLPGLSLGNISSFPLEEMLFIWFLGGLSATIFHALIGIDYQKYKSSSESSSWFLSFLGFLITFSWLTVGIIAILEWSTITALIISSLIISLYIWIKRSNLFLDSLISGALMATLVLFSSTISYSISGAESNFSFIESTQTLFGIPLDLLAFSALIGLFLGPLYEYTRKLPLKHGQ